jgi:hypothetical protein
MPTRQRTRLTIWSSNWTMNSVQTQVVAQAATEYEEEGVVSTTTYCALTLCGLEADKILEDIEETSNGR